MKPTTERAAHGPGIRVTVLDLHSGETETKKVPAGEYLLLTTNPCWLAHTQAHANGTHVLTVKGRIKTWSPPPTHGEGET